MTETVSETVHDGQAAAGEWVSTRVATERLGIGERTVFRRIGRGQLRKRLRPDGKIEVWVPLSTTDVLTDTGRQVAEEQTERALVLVERFGQAVAAQTAPLLAELSAMRTQMVDLAQENGRLHGRVDELERRLSEALPTTVTKTVADRQAARSWWQRLLGRSPR